MYRLKPTLFESTIVVQLDIIVCNIITLNGDLIALLNLKDCYVSVCGTCQIYTACVKKFDCRPTAV